MRCYERISIGTEPNRTERVPATALVIAEYARCALGQNRRAQRSRDRGRFDLRVIRFDSIRFDAIRYDSFRLFRSWTDGPTKHALESLI
mmetsp:Transcript_20616/g.48458  ORF Transcript_20616/g.48458 Transcript_20616/m.48458 type:complete len:89 (-) Transcript_20616:406-672(-)